MNLIGGRYTNIVRRPIIPSDIFFETDSTIKLKIRNATNYKRPVKNQVGKIQIQLSLKAITKYIKLFASTNTQIYVYIFFVEILIEITLIFI